MMVNIQENSRMGKIGSVIPDQKLYTEHHEWILKNKVKLKSGKMFPTSCNALKYLMFSIKMSKTNSAAAWHSISLLKT